MYKYVFVGLDDDFFRTLYAGFGYLDYCDWILLPPSILHRNFFENVLNSVKLPLTNLRQCFFYHLSYRKTIEKYSEISADNYEPNCRIIIYSRVYERLGDSIVNYIKKILPDSILISYYGDLVSSHRINLKHARNKFDLIASFDLKDASKNSIRYLQEPYSYNLKSNKPTVEYDVFYVGSSKGRLNKILNAYHYFTEMELKCLFYIVGVDDDELNPSEGLVLNQRLTYQEVITLIEKSRSILEIVQDGGYSASSRYSEAIVFDKVLISDCKQFNEEANLPQNILYFDSIEDVTKEMIFKSISGGNDNLKHDLSIEKMIESIETYLK